MNIAVCEDKSSDSDALCAYIQSYCEKNCYDGKVSSFSTGEELLGAFSSGAFNLIFLDIFLPGLSGMEVARKIRETDRDCMLVFITVSDDFAMDGFLVQATGYVVKPINREKMAGAMHACRFEFERNSRVVDIPHSGGSVMVSIADLLYAEIFDKEAVLHMKRGDITTRLSLDELEARLGGSPFLRCHRSFIVNMNYVDDMRDEDFLMRNGDTVPIRKNGRKEVRMALAGFPKHPRVYSGADPSDRRTDYRFRAGDGNGSS